MNPKKGQLIQVRLHNGVYFDAIVEEWSDHKSTLKLPNSEDMVVINKTLDNVLLFKIIADRKTTNQNLCEPDAIREELNTLKTNVKTPDSLKKMAELKDEINKLEREEILNKTKSLEPTGARSINYGIPRNLQVSSAAQHSDKKTSSTSYDIGSELRQLFNKKH